MGIEQNNHDMDEGTLEIGMGKWLISYYFLCTMLIGDLLGDLIEENVILGYQY